MSVTGGSVSVRHPAQHRGRSRLSPQAYLATTGRILRQLAADHRSVAMILVVPSLIITLMYFMFQNTPHRPGTPTPFNNACLIMLGVFPLHRDVSDHVDNDAARTGFGNVGAHPHHSPAPDRPAGRVRHGVLDRGGGTGHAGVHRVVLIPRSSTPRAVRSWVFIIAIINAVLGVGLGLLCSAFARTEFQAVQFMPVVIAPQLLLGRHHRPARRDCRTGCNGSATCCRPATLWRRCSRSAPTRN